MKSINTYAITEKSNLNSERAGFEYKGTLRDAKSKASKTQVFQGTILSIEQAGRLVTYKENGKWI